MPVAISVVDAFTDRAFGGNPAAVCRLESFPSDRWMQSMASEMNLSETAFVVDRPDGDRDLRWFTPGAEVDLCGHATLATAHLVGAGRFHTRSGVLACTVGDDGLVEMDFPALPAVPATVDVQSLSDALGCEPVGVYRSRFDLLIEVADASVVRGLQPDIDSLVAFGARGYCVTAAGDRDGIACVSRFFAPNVGVREDPVTGSAHCMLGPFWAERVGSRVLVGEQASARGGRVMMRCEGDRVILGGRATTVWSGTLAIQPT